MLLYQPPCSAVTFLAKLLHFVAELAVKSLRLVTLEDFNLPFDSIETKIIREFMATMETMDLSQIIERSLPVAGSS